MKHSWQGRRVWLLPFLLTAVPGLLRAFEPPHAPGPSIYIDCYTCHSIHVALGEPITPAANVNLCLSCHNPAGMASDLPVLPSDVAVPGVGGTSHAFDVPALSAAYDVQLPENAEIAERVMEGMLVCSTCHNQHRAIAAFGGTPRVSPPKRLTVLASTGALFSGGTFTGDVGVWYLIEIEAAGTESSATFRYSKDAGTSWMASGVAAGSEVDLDSGVTVTFGAGTYQAGEQWRFYGSWPFLRAALDSGDNTSGARFCRDCHRAWAMDDVDVNDGDGTYKSHPVGVGLNSGSRSYDRVVPLDGNGAAQADAGADENPGNDLRLDAFGYVQCLTCHAAHGADGNTQTGGRP